MSGEKTMVVSMFLLFGLLTAPMVGAQNVDLDMDAATFTTFEDEVTVNNGDKFKVNLIVEGAADMTGVSVDVQFDSAALALRSVKEVPGDLDFSGSIQSVEELTSIISQFLNEQNDFLGTTNLSTFVDGHGRSSGVVIDVNGDNKINSIEELTVIINEFLEEQNSFLTAVTPYWTRAVLQAGEDRESVEVFDPVGKSNAGGDNPGIIDDITSVLLRRPGADFSFTGNAIVVTLEFEALQTGTHTFSFPQAVWIDTLFSDLETDVKTLSDPTATPQVVVN